MISKRRFSEVQLYLIKIALVAVVTGLFSAAWYLYYKYQMYFDSFYAKGDIAVVALFLFLYMAFAKLYGGFNLTARASGELAFALTVASVITDFFMYMITCLLTRSIANPLPMLGLLAAMILVGFVWSKLAIALHNHTVPPMKTALIYLNEEARVDGEEIILGMPHMFVLDRQISEADGVEAVLEDMKARRPDAVMLCGIGSTERNDIVKYCINHAIEAYVRPNIGDFLINGAKQMQMCSLPVMLCQRSYPPAWYMVLKRSMDIVLSLAALLVFGLLFMLPTAIAIKLYDGGPVFYKQVRLTKNRKEFYVYKFRSMRVDAEKDGVARLASQNDDRITPIGKIIRRFRIDELPQIFCILKGDMTIVGPRPERPEIAEQYEKEIPEFALRLQAKAGLTGYAQVYGKYNTTPYNKLQMDLQYIGSMGVVTDLKIILATIKTLLVPEATEGVAAGQTTAVKEVKNTMGDEQ